MKNNFQTLFLGRKSFTLGQFVVFNLFGIG